MVRTYEDAIMVFANDEKKPTNLDDFFLMGGSEGVLEQCPAEAYTYRHKERGDFRLHCRICLEHGCKNTKFQRVSQTDEHTSYFQANLEDAYFKHSVDVEHSDECYCLELKQISTSAANKKVRAIYTQIYLVAEKDKAIRFFFKARKPDEIDSKIWALILKNLIMKNEESFPGQDPTKYLNYAVSGECPGWFVSEFTDTVETTKRQFKVDGEQITYRLQGASIPHSSTSVWSMKGRGEIDNLKSDFSIMGQAMICTPLSPNQNGMIGFSNSSRINNLFTLFPAVCHSHHSTAFKQAGEKKPQNYMYWCVDFGGKHLHFTHFNKIGSESQTFFENVEKALKRIGQYNIRFNHKEIKLLEFDIDKKSKTAIFYVKPNQRLSFILRHYDDSNDLRGRSLILDQIKNLTESGGMTNPELKEAYAAKINSRDPVKIEIYEEGVRYVPIRFEIKGSGVLEIQSDDGLTYQKRYVFEGIGESLNLTRTAINPDFAYEELWKGTFDPAGYSPPPTLSKSKENTGARILDMLRDKQSVGGATRQMNQLVSLGFQFNVLDKSIGKVSELDRSFSERMEIIRDVSNHKKFLDRKGLAIGGKTSEYLLLIDRRPGHQLAGNDVKFLGNGSRLITQESDLIDNHIDRFPDLCMYPESPEEFLSVYLDESNHTIQESVLNENYGKLKGYMEDNLETDVYFMVQDKRFEEGLWSRGIEERSWTMKRNDINSDIWKSGKNHNQDMAQILSENFGESTFQIVRTYSYNEDEQFNPHIHQFYLIQYRTNKNPMAHKIFSNTTDDVSFYPMPLSDFFNAGNVQDKRYKRYQFLNDCIRAMYVIINKEELSQIHENTIIEDILWYNMPFQLTRWLEFDKSPLSLLKEVREVDSQLAIFLKESICKSLWIDS
jgi:hypothetical protein